MTAASEPTPPTNGSTALAVPTGNAPMGNRGVVLTDFNALARFAKMVVASGFAPKGMNDAAVGVAIQMGLEVGLSPMQAIQSTAVINGRPGIYGDTAKALVEASGLVEDYDQWFEVNGVRAEHLPTKLTDDVRAVCLSKRHGRRPLVTGFSVADAKAAGLWGKAGPWTQYPTRMLMFRARGFNLRDNFGDVLKGLRTVEELHDIPAAQVTVRDAPALAPGQTRTEALGERLREAAKAEAEARRTSEPPTSAELEADGLAEGEVPTSELFAGAGPYTERN